MSGGELTMSDDLERYSRQMLVAGIGEDGQRHSTDGGFELEAFRRGEAEPPCKSIHPALNER